MKKYTISSPNPGGIRARICSLGARLLTLEIPNGEGEYIDLITGPISKEAIEADNAYMGVSAGRFGNRVARGQYSHNGTPYQLTLNEGKNHLHGGGGLHQKIWEVTKQTEHAITLSIASPDGEDGYPGNVKITATYTIASTNTLRVEYTATTDQDTPVNVVQHAYWNLTGNPRQSIESHVVQSKDLQGYLEINEEMLPTGKILAASGSPFDFSAAKELAPGLESSHSQIDLAGGYDHCLVFADNVSEGLAHSLLITDPSSQRSMRIATNMPAVQLYSGNFLDGSQTGKQGKIERRTGLCVETQHYPDAMNHPHFPSAILTPENNYLHIIEYTFSQP